MKMKAIIQNSYGPPELLKLKEVEKPTPKDDEVLVRVFATSVHPDVWHVVSGFPIALRLMGTGLLKPKKKIPGTDLAGCIEAVGKDVKDFKVGDEVFGESHRKLQWCNGGTYAEYAAVPEDVLAIKPSNVTFEEAASVPTSGIIVLLNLRDDGQIEEGQNVLINGAGGGVGTLALQISTASGAKVTAVDCAEKLDWLSSMGADRVIDYSEEDFTKSGERYDLIIDIPGNYSFSKCRKVLTTGGTYILIGHDNYGKSGHHLFGSIPRFIKLLVMAIFVKQLPKTDFSIPNKKQYMATLRELLEGGKLKPIIYRTYPLSKVPEAIRYMMDNNSKGKVVITLKKVK